jgi:MFS family permease
VYGSLVVVLSAIFFPASASIPPIIPAVGAFVAGAAVRPAGGAIFGRLGDLMGRRFAFVLTTVIMGAGSAAVGLLPTYGQIGILAPIALVLLRVLQGLALGGEYAGSVIYVAENCADRNRGYWTSFIQLAPTLGLLLSFGIILPVQLIAGAAAFHNWGWRIPFLAASVLLMVAIAARWKLTETSLFSALKDIKKTSSSPLFESIRQKSNLKLVILALVIVSGASVVWHTAQFYTSIFMQTSLKISFAISAEVTAIALVLGSPMFILFGRMSDRIGRLKIILIGNVLAAASFYPIYYAIDLFSHPPDVFALAGLLFVQISISAMCYGPLGAFLVEYFPARIRYTSMSISHGIGTGDVGDGTLVIAPVLALVLGNVYGGLIWAIAVPSIVSFVSVLLVKETKETSIWLEVQKKH